MIEEIVRALMQRTPRLVCICGNFQRVERDEVLCWSRCACGGWRSDVMNAEGKTGEP